MLLLHVLLLLGSAACGSPFSQRGVPTVPLTNGVEMPVVLFGTGAATWQNNTSTEAVVSEGLVAGFPGIDTANHYENQLGVSKGVSSARKKGVTGKIWLQTKVEGCGGGGENSTSA